MQRVYDVYLASLEDQVEMRQISRHFLHAKELTTVHQSVHVQNVARRCQMRAKTDGTQPLQYALFFAMHAERGWST